MSQEAAKNLPGVADVQRVHEELNDVHKSCRAALLEADKNGYERGRKEIIEEISDVIGEHEAESDLKIMFAVIRFLDEARLALRKTNGK